MNNEREDGMDKAQEIQNAHIWLRHGDSMFGYCLCGTTRPITVSEHSDHIRSMEDDTLLFLTDY